MSDSSDRLADLDRLAPVVDVASAHRTFRTARTRRRTSRHLGMAVAAAVVLLVLGFAGTLLLADGDVPLATTGEGNDSDTQDAAVAEADADRAGTADDPSPGTLSCGGAIFPAEALKNGPAADYEADDAARELRALIRQQQGWDDPHAIQDGDWRVLDRRTVGGGDQVVFGSGAPPRPSLAVIRRAPDGEWFTAQSGPCWTRKVVNGRTAVYWEPADVLDPTARSVPILVKEMACASGQPPDGRVRLEVEERDDAVLITATVVPLSGSQTCPGAPPAEVLVQLSSALDMRELFDGGAVPPQPSCIPDNQFEGCPPSSEAG